jgi:trehalose-phosphatase
VARRLADRHVLLALDYDGTLTPIVPHPDEAVLPAGVREVLRRLSRRSQYHIAIISGRSLADIRERMDMEGVIYAGNHGLQIEGPDMRLDKTDEPSRSILTRLRAELISRLDVPGAWLEDKGLTMSLHCRQTPEEHLPRLERIVETVCEPYSRRDEIKVTRGKRVYEIRPPVEWNKGHALLWMMDRLQERVAGRVLAVYVGDDVTDEDAFAAVGDRGVTVAVGGPPGSRARYFLNGTDEVERLLRQLILCNDPDP